MLLLKQLGLKLTLMNPPPVQHLYNNIVLIKAEILEAICQRMDMVQFYKESHGSSG